MPNPYHKNIQRILTIICSENQNKFLGSYCGNKKIEINHPTIARKSIVYYPDFVIVSKQGPYYIFQILDSQDEHKDMTVANVINAYLTENIKKLFFVMQNDKIKKEVNEITEVILEKIKELSKRTTLRSKLNVFSTVIPENADDNNIKKSLETVLFDIPEKIEKEIEQLQLK